LTAGAASVEPSVFTTKAFLMSGGLRLCARGLLLKQQRISGLDSVTTRQSFKEVKVPAKASPSKLTDPSGTTALKPESTCPPLAATYSVNFFAKLVLSFCMATKAKPTFCPATASSTPMWTLRVRLPTASTNLRLPSSSQPTLTKLTSSVCALVSSAMAVIVAASAILSNEAHE